MIRIAAMVFAVAALLGAAVAHGQDLPVGWTPKLLNKQQTKERYEQIAKEMAEREKRGAELKANREARQEKQRERVEEMRRAR